MDTRANVQIDLNISAKDLPSFMDPAFDPLVETRLIISCRRAIDGFMRKYRAARNTYYRDVVRHGIAALWSQ